jgi:hypothetical protein
MSIIPLVLPLKASEAAALADLVFQQLEGNPLTADLRNRFAARLPLLGLETFTPFSGSLARDPIHPSTYYIAIDTIPDATPLLLRIALASSPASGLFPSSMLIGRMRPGGGREIVINAIPFHFSDREHVRTFANAVDPAFLPRSQGPQSAIVAEGTDLSSAFRAFRAILKATGLNLAAIAENFDIALWSAIRAGWREGWNAQSSDPSAADYTMFSASGSVEQLAATYDRIRAMKAGRVFDFEIATPDINALDWMRSHGRPVQFINVSPDADLRALSENARQHNAILSFAHASESQLEQIALSTAGRFLYRTRADEPSIRAASSTLLGKTI